MSELVIRFVDPEQDAEGIAATWNASDSAWPGGWTGGVPVSRETAPHADQTSRS